MPLRAACGRILVSGLALIAFLCPAAAWATWPHDLVTGNVPVCAAINSQMFPLIVPDGAGGTILVWQDQRSGTFDIYAQRLDATGVPLWTPNGVAVCNAANDQSAPSIEPDGAGGVFIAWADARLSATPDIYAQRLNASGVPQWTANGVVVCNATSNQFAPVLVADGAGGVFVTWYDKRTTVHYDIYSQRLNGAGAPLWTPNGVAVCNVSGDQFSPRACTDNSGGEIITWYDGRPGTNFDIYAQRLNSAGAAVWTANGLAVDVSSTSQYYPVIAPNGTGGAFVAWQTHNGTDYDIWFNQISSAGGLGNPSPGYVVAGSLGDQAGTAVLSDGSGGVFVAWNDHRDGSHDRIYAQHYNGNNWPLWAQAGFPVSDVTGDQVTPALTTDGAGGMIVTWTYQRTYGPDYDVAAQWMSSTGVAQWGSSGIVLSNALGHTYGSAIASDGAGGAVVAITDNRTGQSDIYAQRVDRYGQIGNAEPALVSVRDVANDQGGKVKLTWNASYMDAFPSYGIATYGIWRAVPPTTALSAIARGARLAAADDVLDPVAGTTYQVLTQGAAVTYWEFLASQPADGQPGYSYLAATASDSIAGANPLTSFMVEARAAVGTGRWYSAPDSAYSVDNLPPASPSPFTASYAAGTTSLTWGPSSAPDFATFRLCRGNSAAFVPGPGNLVATTSALGFTDPAGQPYFYKLAAQDVHGNLSAYALVQPSGTTGVDAPAPVALHLDFAGPNPARGGTALRYGLPAAATVSLILFDEHGRQVRTLTSGSVAAGEHLVPWDGRDDAGHAVAAGIYFARLQAADRSLTRRLVSIR